MCVREHALLSEVAAASGVGSAMHHVFPEQSTTLSLAEHFDVLVSFDGKFRSIYQGNIYAAGEYVVTDGKKVAVWWVFSVRGFKCGKKPTPRVVHAQY